MIKRFIALMLAALTLIACCACGNPNENPDGTGDDTEAVAPEKTVEVILAGGENGDYAVIFPEKYSMNEGILCWDIYNALGGKDASLAIPTDDWMKAGQTEDTNTLEILLGTTNRSASASVADKIVHPKDFLISVVDNKVVVYSGDLDGMTAAVSYFVSHITEKDGKKVLEIPENCYTSFEYPFSSMTIGGKSVYEYSIVYPEGSVNGSDKATQINEWFLENIGEALPVKDSTAAETECEILIGNTGRAASMPYYSAGTSVEINGYAVKLDGTKLVLAYDGSGVRAVDKFLEIIDDAMNIETLSIEEQMSDYEIFRYDNFAAGRLSDALLDSVNPGVLALLSECMYYEYKLQEAISKGEKWVYSNSSTYVKQNGSFEDMMAAGNSKGGRGSNCAMPQSWIHNELKIIPSGHVYGNSSGGIANLSSYGKYITAVASLTSWSGSCEFNQLYNKGLVKPGDIFFCIGHTFIYLGDDLFMAAGHDGKWHSDPSAATEDSRNAVFESWLQPRTKCSDWTYDIYWQERFKDDFIPEYYRNSEGKLVKNPMYAPDLDIRYKAGKSPEQPVIEYKIFK